MGPPSSLACGPGSPWPTCPCARLETNATFGRTWGLIHLSLGTPHPRRPWAYRLCRRPDVGVPFLALTGDSQRLLSSHVASARSLGTMSSGLIHAAAWPRILLRWVVPHCVSTSLCSSTHPLGRSCSHVLAGVHGGALRGCADAHEDTRS